MINMLNFIEQLYSVTQEHIHLFLNVLGICWTEITVTKNTVKLTLTL